MSEDWTALELERKRREFVESRRRGHSLALHLAIIFTLTAGAGWLVSWLLLVLAHVHAMPLRYALAFAVSYAVFALAVRAWSDHMRAERGGAGGWESVVDFGGAGGEGCLVVLAVFLAALAAAGVVVAIGGETALLEVAFEVVFAGAVVRRARRIIVVGDWLGTLVRKTWLPALAIGLALTVIAAVLQWKAPEASTLREALRAIFRPA